MSRTRQEREWDKEKDNLRKTEATGLFKAMLVDLVSQSLPCNQVYAHIWTVCVRNCVGGSGYSAYVNNIALNVHMNTLLMFGHIIMYKL